MLTLRRFKYDALGQLTQAQFATVNAPVQDQNSTYLPPSYTPSTNYKLWNLTYDKNGNLQTLDRNGRGEGAMDQLAYTYALDGNGHKTNNRLLQVTDEVNTSAYHQLPTACWPRVEQLQLQRHGPTDRRCAGGKYYPTTPMEG
ncbi:MAG: hypothetical protein IPI72_14485 [Flavobacteriales bacterium]|nr:hypothetical protein [Flavobacteriales bacterium]